MEVIGASFKICRDWWIL